MSRFIRFGDTVIFTDKIIWVGIQTFPDKPNIFTIIFRFSSGQADLSYNFFNYAAAKTELDRIDQMIRSDPMRF